MDLENDCGSKYGMESDPVKANIRVDAPRWFALCCLCLATLSALGGCHKTPAAATPAQETAASEAPESGAAVALKPEEIKHMGIVTTPAQTIMHSPEATGFAMVLAHEGIATAVAELDTAAATQRQSRAALERTQHLAGTAGAMPADTMDGLQRQAAVDQVALELSQRKLSSMFGQNSPWRHQTNSPLLRALASGDAKLVRVSFPLGATDDVAPRSLRLAPINASQGGGSVETHSVWSAPADASVPGRSYFAYLKSGDFGEGEHLLAWVPVGAAQAGVLVPDSAAIISGGKYWCFVEEKPGEFHRFPLDPSSTTVGGYFVREGIEAGAMIVTMAAGQLLAREQNPSTAPAD